MKSDPLKYILLLILVGGVTFIIFRPFAYLIAIALLITIGGVALYYSFQLISRLFRKFRIRNTMAGIIDGKIEVLQSQITMLKEELTTITNELSDIDQQLNGQELSPFVSDKLIRLRDAFEIEEELKSEKLAFYELTMSKFEALLSDRKALKKISSKKEKLRKVRRENTTEDLVPNEHLSTDKEIIEELDYLTLRMENSVHIDEAKDIRKELVSLYR